MDLILNGDLKLSNIQRNIILTQELFPNSSLLNVGGFAEITGEIDENRLLTAISEVIQTSDIFDLYLTFLKNNSKTEHERIFDYKFFDYSSHENAGILCEEWMNDDIADPIFQQSFLLITRLFKIKDNLFYWYVKTYHAIFDGFSMSLFFNKVSKTYLSLKNHDGSLSEIRPGSYERYIVSEALYQKSDQFRTDSHYWKSKLEVIDNNRLFSSVSQPNNNFFEIQSQRQNLKIERLVFDKIQSYCGLNNISVYHFFISTILTANHLSDNPSGVLGLPVSNRLGLESKNTFGAFANMRPFYIETERFNSFLSLAIAVKSLLNSDYRHQKYNLIDILNDLNIDRSLFNVTFSYQKNQYERLLEANVKINYLNNKDQLEDLAIHLLEYDDDNDLILAFDFKKACFTEEVQYSLLNIFRNVIEQVMDMPGLEFKDIELAEKCAINDVVLKTNHIEQDDRKNLTVLDIFNAQVKTQNNFPAIRCGHTELSYQEVAELSFKFAEYLISNCGIKAGNIVAVQISRTIYLPVILLGILKTGSAYLPIDKSYPENRVLFIIKDSQCQLLVDDALVDKALANNFRSDYREATEQIDVSDNDLAYVIYTSGSTGHPKGVLVEHKNVVQFARNLSERFDFKKGMQIAALTTYSFDISVLELICSLTIGLTVVMFDEKDPMKILNKIKNDHIDALQITPSGLNQLLNTTDGGKIIGGLKILLVGGEALPGPLFSKIRNELPLVKAYNVYGPTETTIWSSSLTINEADELSIGTPLINEYILITNQYGRLMPSGITGEICIGGSGVTRGYLNRQELTNQKFVHNIYHNGNARLYRTGDRGKIISDGVVSYSGRQDDQVKVRGYRIEIGEVEDALQRLADIEQCAVTAREDANGIKILVGFVVSANKWDRNDLVTSLKKTLPDYMIPTLWIPVAKLPINSNGKIDRTKLKSWNIVPTVPDNYVPARNEQEAKLVLIWKDALRIEKIGIFDDFFELGGHSLVAAKLISVVRLEFKNDVSILDVFEYPTISGFSEMLDTLKKIEPEENQIVDVSKPVKIPLSFSQERLWFMDKLNGSLNYHIPIVMLINGTVDREILSWAFCQIVSRHEALRTIIYEEDGIPYLKVKDNSAWDIQNRKISDPFDKDAMHPLITELIYRPFNLFSDFMIRVEQLEFSNGINIVSIVVHHFAFDGLSVMVLLNELMELYDSKLSGRPSELSSSVFQYSDYAVRQRNYLSGQKLINGLNYWKQQLTGVAALNLPFDYSKQSIKSINGKSVRMVAVDNTYNSLKTFSNSEKTTLFTTLIAAFKVLLYHYTSQTDLSVGIPVGNRIESVLDGMIGYFSNTVIFRTELKPDGDFTNLLKQVKLKLLNLHQYQDIPFEKVLNTLEAGRGAGAENLLNVMFSCQNFESLPDFILGEAKFEVLPVESSFSKFDLLFDVLITSAELVINIEYNSDLFNKCTIEAMGHRYLELLKNLLAEPAKPIFDIDWLTYNERQQLLSNFNRTAEVSQGEETLLDLFRAQVELRGEETAVVFEDSSLTYRELDARSNQLAHYLVRRGVKPGSLVPVCVERSLEMIIGLLGILKSGGAYVPIDPDYPSDRIRYILEDTSAELLLSSGELLGAVSGHRELVLMDRDGSQISKEATTGPGIKIAPGSLAYVIYTSGSTGRPKGVMVEHLSLANRLIWSQDYFNLTTDDVILQKTTFSFDVSVWELFWPLMAGAKLVFAIPGGHGDPKYLKSVIQSEKITTIHFVPSMFEAFLNSAAEGDCKTLKRVLCSGEALKAHQVTLFREKFKALPLFNLYGPTEATVDVSCWDVKGDIKAFPNLPIGKPITNTVIYIVDREMNLVPVGIPGELYIGGVQVSRGYLNRGELTMERFVANPYGPGRLYRTGDLGRWLPDGNIEYLGRMDDQVKIRGYRIELGEIESVLVQHAGISEALVVAREQSSGDKYLAAYYVSSDGRELDSRELKEYLGGQLPGYMVPSAYVWQEQFRLTANGKIDKKSLPEPLLVRSGHEGVYVRPVNDTEKALVAIYIDILHIDKVGVLDNFFVLGGDSLLSVRIISKIKSIFQVEIPLKQFFELENIREISHYLDIQQLKQTEFLDEYKEITI